jgi:hypothetical protein
VAGRPPATPVLGLFPESKYGLLDPTGRDLVAYQPRAVLYPGSCSKGGPTTTSSCLNRTVVAR